MNANESVIIEFVNAWSRLNADELADYFHENGTYYNIPINPVTGRNNIKKFIKNFTSTWKETNWEILNIMSVNNIVFTERMGQTITTEGEYLDLPCVGVFEMEDNKIYVWRDYFDLGTYLRVFE